MATLLSALETRVRFHLREATAKFWTSAELINYFNEGIQDLEGAILDLSQDHFITIDTTNVSLTADSSTLTGVPSDVFRVVNIEPRDLSSGSATRHVHFTPRDLNHRDFRAARGQTAVAAGEQQDFYYAIINAGAPVAAPTIQVAPQSSSAINLALTYNQTLTVLTASGTNPIPGESDAALIAYTMALAKAKEREDHAPDPEWIAVYSTHKSNLLTRLTPRQVQEPEVVEALYGDWW
ncbi:hypothetical protein LCGC14_0520980 [marine sediment metagenome]|uniref:Uncharacterized protein n=1 Tax=marine sediment metagenome TaxID=412755 RepID=A0A0F9RYH7_9ZZZZ